MEYPKIETLFHRDPETFKVNGIFRNPIYSTICVWDWTEKIDGTNIRVQYEDDKARILGRTDRANIPADLFNRILERLNLEYLHSTFKGSKIVIYGEGFGPGIQKGGGYGKEKDFRVFDIVVGRDSQWWLNRENTTEIANKLGFEMVPYYGRMSLDDAIVIVKNGFKSIVAGADTLSEGLVGRPVEPLFDNKGSRLIVKLKTKDFV